MSKILPEYFENLKLLRDDQGTSYVDIDTYSCAHDKHGHKNPQSPGVFIINETDNVIFQSHVIAPAGPAGSGRVCEGITQDLS